MLTVALLAFVLFQYVGDPVTIMLGQDATDAERIELRERLGLNEPAVVQFGHFVANAAQGNFGISLRQSEPVSTLLKSRLPATLELSLVAAVLALVVGVPLGVYTALKRNSMLSQLLLAGSLLGVSLPTFLIGILLILVFSVQLGWLPSYGRGETVSLGWWSSGLFTADGWKHLILPSITLSLFQMTLVLRLVRSEMLEVLRSDYIKFARARSSAAPSTSATRSRTRWCPSSPSRDCSWAASSPSPSSRKPCSSGRAWACCSSRPCNSPTCRSWPPICA